MISLPSLSPKALVTSLVALAALLPAGCTPSGFGSIASESVLSVKITGGDRGKLDKRLPITFDAPARFTLSIEALGPDGKRDTGFNGFVHLSTKPGTVLPVTGSGAHGRNVQLANGVADNVAVDVLAAYGDTRIWVEDLGYEPGNASGKPRCSDGVDNDNDGLVDFPADPGCSAADDETENPGTFATGASDPLFFSYPRVADVRGVNQGGGATPFPKEQIQIDTGYDRSNNKFAHSVVVTRIASDGFYVTDIDDPRGYSSVFAFTFNPPAKLSVCDRLVAFSGTAADFYGFTEINFPAWSDEERVCHYEGEKLVCNRPCLVPEPRVLTRTDLGNLKTKLAVTASLVRIETKDAIQVRIGKHFGSGPGKLENGAYTFGDDASSCDFNGSGKIDFSNPDEAACSNACDADAECVEWSGYAARSDIDLVMEEKDAQGRSLFTKVQANASAAPDFDPYLNRGKPLRAFSGTLRYFSGGSQFTIEARCQDDIVTDLKANPMSSEEACLVPRLETDNNAGTQ